VLFGLGEVGDLAPSLFARHGEQAGGEGDARRVVRARDRFVPHGAGAVRRSGCGGRTAGAAVIQVGDRLGWLRFHVHWSLGVTGGAPALHFAGARLERVADGGGGCYGVAHDD
jgi:hypothetical protein